MSTLSNLELPLRHKMAANPVFYAIGDIHGRADLLTELLDHIREDAERDGLLKGAAAGPGEYPEGRPAIVYLGDYIDRGPDSLKVLERVFQDNPGFDTYRLLGNHDDFLLQVLTLDNEASLAFILKLWHKNGGYAFPSSFPIVDPGLISLAEQAMSLGDPSFVDFLKAYLPEEIRAGLLNDTLHVLEAENLVFVHAGIDPDVPISEQNSEIAMWTREGHFFNHPDPADGKVVIHGHTILPRLDPGHGIVGDEHPMRIGIDIGAYKNGRLLACRISQDGNACFLRSDGAKIPSKFEGRPALLKQKKERRAGIGNDGGKSREWMGPDGSPVLSGPGY